MMVKTTPPIAILGMHRSGTSALAGSLKQAGVYLGRVADKGSILNEKGLQEPMALLRMHEDLLVKNGGAWHSPPESTVWAPLHTAVRDLFIESREGHSLWGFKDPRTLLVLDGWTEALPDLRCVGIFRHPTEVAASLYHRNQFPMKKGVELWHEYNQRLLDRWRAGQFPLVEFVADQQRMTSQLNDVFSWIGAKPTSEPDFMDVGLRSFAASKGDLDAEVPAHVMATYRQLQMAVL